MCSDVHETVASLKKKGVAFTSPVTEESYGFVTSLEIPGGGEIGLYQPKHPVALESWKAAR